MSAAFDFDEFWEFIEKRREGLGLSQEAAALKSGFSRPTWHNYKTRKYSPSLEHLQALAMTLELEFRSPIVRPGSRRSSDPSGTVSPVQQGGINLTDDLKRVVAYATGLDKEEQQKLATVISGWLELQGFASPNAEQHGAADVRQT